MKWLFHPLSKFSPSSSSPLVVFSFVKGPKTCSTQVTQGSTKKSREIWILKKFQLVITRITQEAANLTRSVGMIHAQPDVITLTMTQRATSFLCLENPVEIDLSHSEVLPQSVERAPIGLGHAPHSQIAIAAFLANITKAIRVFGATSKCLLRFQGLADSASFGPYVVNRMCPNGRATLFLVSGTACLAPAGYGEFITRIAPKCCNTLTNQAPRAGFGQHLG